MANLKRLIDANALKKAILAEPWKDKPNMVRLTVDYINIIVDEQPTVDAAPVVHAHWEDGCAIHNGKEVYKSIDCSHCNEIFKTEDREYWKKRFKVCPFCGAIMDGERRTNEPEEPV